MIIVNKDYHFPVSNLKFITAHKFIPNQQRWHDTVL